MLTSTLRGMFAHKLRLVLTTASIALGLWDRMRHGAPGAWDKAEGTR